MRRTKNLPTNSFHYLSVDTAIKCKENFYTNLCFIHLFEPKRWRQERETEEERWGKNERRRKDQCEIERNSHSWCVVKHFSAASVRIHALTINGGSIDVHVIDASDEFYAQAEISLGFSPLMPLPKPYAHLSRSRFNLSPSAVCVCVSCSVFSEINQKLNTQSVKLTFCVKMSRQKQRQTKPK